MAKKNVTMVKASAKLKKNIINKNGCQLVLDQYQINAKDSHQLNRWIKSEEPLIMTVGDVRVALKIEKMTVSKNSDLPKLSGLKFSSSQGEEIQRYVQSDSTVDLSFEPDTENMFQDQLDAAEAIED